MEFLKKIFKKKSNNNLIIIILLASLFGLLGGVSGQIFSSSYLLKNYYQMPYIGEINLRNGVPAGSLVIRDARKVVVEQDDKIQDTANYARESLVGIYRKKTVTPGETQTFNLDNYYRWDEERGQGIVITSDGWILTSAFSPNIRTETDITANYVIITRDQKIYEIDKVIRDPSSKFGFVRAKNVRDLNVSKFDADTKTKEGAQILSLNWKGEVFLSRILNSDLKKPGVKSSDSSILSLALDSTLPESLKGSPIFDLSGFLVAIVDEGGNIEQFSNYIAEVNSLLKYGEIRRGILGISYVDLSDFIIDDKNYQKGALISKNEAGTAIIKNSPADLAGLKEGDILLMVDNNEINADNSLNEIMQKYLAGDTISVSYTRAGEKLQTKITLAGLK